MGGAKLVERALSTSILLLLRTSQAEGSGDSLETSTEALIRPTCDLVDIFCSSTFVYLPLRFFSVPLGLSRTTNLLPVLLLGLLVRAPLAWLPQGSTGSRLPFDLPRPPVRETERQFCAQDPKRRGKSAPP